jgi:hypothetical protein
MKKFVLLLAFVCAGFISQAQQDSIRVVIECDSLYRPFLEHAGKVRVLGSKALYPGNRSHYFDLNRNNFFYIPIPKSDDELFEVMVYCKDFAGHYLQGETFIYNKTYYKRALYNIVNGKLLPSKKIYFDNRLTIKFKFPIRSISDKFLIDNSCPYCNRNDSVSWITYGLLVENPITGEVKLPEVFNPYNNPISEEIYNPGCNVGSNHWYCHSCKKEY